MDDQVVPPSTSDFLQRVLPDAMVHKLPYEGHFTYFYFCDECHREMLSTALGTPQGPLASIVEQKSVEEVDEGIEEIVLDDIPIPTDTENVSSST